MHYIIYKTTNLVNGKFYIGKHQTNDLNDGYIGSGKLLKRAIKKYGLDNLKTDIIIECLTETHMNLAEKILVVIDSEVSYNLCPGGHGGFGYINKNIDYDQSVLKAKHASASHTERLKDPYYRTAWIDAINKSKTSEYYVKLQKARNIRSQREEGTFKNKRHAPSSIDKMKLSHRDKHSGENNSQFGTCWVSNNSDVRKIKKEDLDFWLNSGYHRGRK